MTCVERPAVCGSARSCFNRPTVKITMTIMKGADMTTMACSRAVPAGQQQHRGGYRRDDAPERGEQPQRVRRPA